MRASSAWDELAASGSHAPLVHGFRAEEFLTGPQVPTSFRCSKQAGPPPGPKICYHYPGEDTSKAVLTPPESSGVHTTDHVNKDHYLLRRWTRGGRRCHPSPAICPGVLSTWLYQLEKGL
ncbi:Putative enoyl-CoA hydratase [Durusdinium trenchii]|uniref:Mitochondrial n=1 Tax=Durusdinium trenchii TaxID=1381693 RepID=A0ABP0RE40_9DINO